MSRELVKMECYNSDEEYFFVNVVDVDGVVCCPFCGSEHVRKAE